MKDFQATTIVAVQKDGLSALGGDGQVTFGEHTIMKHGAKKVRRLHHNRILAGFAGSAADSFTLFEKFEAKLEEHHGQLLRAAVELGKLWRSDKVLRKLEALMIVMDNEQMLVLSGAGDIIEPDDSVVAIGSGGSYAMAAAKALKRHSSLKPAEIVVESLKIAADICVYTNDSITVLELGEEGN